MNFNTVTSTLISEIKIAEMKSMDILGYIYIKLSIKKLDETINNVYVRINRYKIGSHTGKNKIVFK